MESRLSSLPELGSGRLALVVLALGLAVVGCRPSSGPERAETPVAPVALPRPAAVTTTTPTAAAPRVEAGDLDRAEVVIGGVSFEAELAVDPSDRAKGLSGRASLKPMTGMLFVFESPTASSFWMKEMRFPLDFVWIGEDCAVVDITAEVPAPTPGTVLADLPRYSSLAPAAYNFEINAGEAKQVRAGSGRPCTDLRDASRCRKPLRVA